MIIHVVQPGETINAIADNYGISVDRLILENEFVDPYKLVVGQTIVIVYPKQIYIVKEGDTLAGIADAEGTTLMELLRNNPYLSDRESLYIGETIVISYDENKTMKMSTNGYAYPFIEINTLKKTLPFLTYLTVFTYSITAEGELNDLDDKKLIQLAKEYGVAPIMLISTLSESGTIEPNIAHTILNSEELQNRLVDNVLIKLKEKGYYGLNLDSQYVLPSDRQLYDDFTTKMTTRLNSEGFKVEVTITPSAFELVTRTLYQGIDYAGLGQAANGVMIIHYAWGQTYEISIVAMSFDMTKSLLDYAITKIPPEKISVGITSIGYIYQLPYITCVSSVQSISHENAMQLAREVDATILYNETSEASYFYAGENDEYLVWFKDARSLDNIIKLVPEYGLQGIGIWNIMYYLAPMFLIINSQYEIEKVI